MKKRILSILLTLCMTLCLTPISVFAEEVGAEGSAAIQLGTGALSKNVNTATAPTVYFGQNHENDSGAWRVIGYDGSGVTSAQGDITLLAAGAMGVIPFADIILYNDYAPSNLKTAIDALAEKLTTEENAAVKKRTLTSGSYNGENTDCVAGGQVDNAVFWPLSTKEAIAVNNDLRALDPAHPNWVTSSWYLRSPGSKTFYVAIVSSDGSVQYSGASIRKQNNHLTVRAAFNLNLNSVLFTSAAVGGKPDGGLTEVPEYSGNEWKLTLLDSSRNFAVTEKAVCADPNDTITLNYSGATTGANEYISAIIADNNGAQYYGRVAQPTAESGTVEIKIPSDIAPGNYTLKVFSEQYNGDYKTDYASNFTDIALTVEKQVEEQFSLTPGGRYYFDLSAMNIPGTANGGNSDGAVSLPDTSLHYVPFTYVGTIEAYKLTSATATTEEYAQQNKYPHSLFVADYAVTHTISWGGLNDEGLIFGKNYASGGVDYTMRAPSAGSQSNNNNGKDDSSTRGIPKSNEWDAILDKANQDWKDNTSGYIKNWSRKYSFGQDNHADASIRAVRGHGSARYWRSYYASYSLLFVGFRPVLEILNADTLDSDGLKVVTLDLNGGKLGGSSDAIHIIVKNGSKFTAPASNGLTRPAGNTGSYFMWLGSNGKFYAPGDSVPADVTKLTAQFALSEQFSLKPGDTYYFDLSAMNIPGTANGGNSDGAVSLPDTSLHYVPFTYVGTIEAYKLTSATATTEEYAQQNKYPHSLFVADYAVTHTISWGGLNDEGLIFGKNYASGGVDYTLRAPSVGSISTGSGDSQRGVPQSNEWDTMLNKNSGYIQNWNKMYSWGQDTSSAAESFRAYRGYNSARFWYYTSSSFRNVYLGFRPVLEVLNPGTLGSDGLKVVTLDLGGGKLGNSSEDIQIIVKTGSEFTAPASDGLTRPDGNTGSYFMWLGSNGKLYAPGASVPADVTELTVQWTAPTYAVTLNTNGGTINNGNVTEYTYGVGATLPTDVTRTGYTFKGWYYNENLTGSPVTAIGDTETGNKEYWAKWEINQYTVTVKPENGEADITITQDYGTPITAPADPIREGYTFIGWDRDIPKTMPAENITVTAQWEINQYTITFDTNGGSEIAPITQDYGTEITAPADPTREGYTFIGWDKAIPTTMPAENITVTAQWKDSEKPTGEIKINENSWKAFLNNITFGLFFKDTQTVTINAADNSGETVTVEYLLSDKELTKAEFDGMTFTAYTAPFGIDPDNEYIIYVRLTDNAGNTDYICSDGIVLDGTSPVITGIEDGKTYCEAQTVTITEKYVDTVTVNGTVVTLDTTGSFTLAPADGEQKIVVTDKAGNTAEMTVTVNDGHTFGEWTSNGDGTHTRQCTVDGCTEGIETDNCTDEDKNHICDICGNIISNHEDANQDHVCDLCGKVISNHEDADKDHVCDHCGKVISNHEDADNNHICDYCEKVISNHEDADKDHICDLCGKTISNHEDADNNHICDYCGKTISNHEDANKDHVCDYCGKTISNHEDADKDHICDLCGKVISNHEDASKDHVCDYCEKVISNHEDADKDHICDHCGKVISNHEDASKDHVCELCGKTISNHEDANKDHVCDYCGKVISNHEDADKDHVCDYCGKVITNHIGGKETCRDKAVCEVCGKSYGKLDPNNHTDLKHFPAKAATEDADGNIEYWYCSGCNKYYSDKDGTKEIAKADTVTAKLPKSPPTGDNSNLMLWIALLFISGGVLTGVTVFDKRKRHSVK